MMMKSTSVSDRPLAGLAPAFKSGFDGGAMLASPAGSPVDGAARKQRTRSERREFTLSLYGMFAVFLVVGAVSRILPGRWQPVAGVPQPQRRSLLAEARAAAHEVTPFIFMR